MAALAIAAAFAVGIAPARAATTPGSTYFPVTPTRLLDTRTGSGPLGPGASLDLAVVDVAGVPSSGVTAVVLNVTAVDATAQGSYLTVYPAGGSRPLASNLNVTAGTTSTNLVTVAVPPLGNQAGVVTIYNNAGSVNVVADINGWYSANGGRIGATYHPVTPDRVLDTRNGVGLEYSLVFPGQTIDVQVAGRGGVPETGVSAVVLNVTAIHEAGPESFLTVYPAGTVRPLASNLNFFDHRAVPNLVVARIGTDGKVSMYNNLGLANFVADVQGWYTSIGTTTGATYFPLSPTRALDTRVDPFQRRMGAGETLDFHPLGTDGAGLAAAVLNVTAVDYAGPGTFITVFPAAVVRPLASNLNVVDGQTIPNLVFAQVGANRKVSIYNNAGSVDLVVDVQGWFLTKGA
jgi:hypothetical protein